MDAPADSGPVNVDSMQLDVLRRAVQVYLEIAYPSGNPSEAVRRRTIWVEGLSNQERFAKPPFERAGKTPGDGAPIFALRLGNHRYPHMKLQFQPWNNAEGVMLSVNTHDQIAGLDLISEDAEAFRTLQAENQGLKERIELAWEAAGLPTFLNFLRSYIESRTEEEGPSA